MLAAAAAVVAGLALAPDIARAQEAGPERDTVTVAAEAMGTAYQAPPARQVTLDEAIEIGLRRNPGLEQALSQLSTARFDRLNSVGSFLPNLSLGYGYSDASTGRLDPTGQAITRTSVSAQLRGSVTLFEGMRRFHELDRAEKSVEAQEATRTQRRYETILNVKTAYYSAVASHERVQVERARVERQLEQLDFVRQQIRLGQAVRSDSLTSRVDLNNARLALLNARNAAQTAEFQLAQAMGVTERVTPVEEATLTIDSLAYSRDELMTMAVEYAPSVRSARLNAEAAEEGVQSAQASYLPTLNLSGGWAWQNSEYPPKNRSWSLSLSGNVPIFNGFQRETSVARARVQADAAQAQTRAARLAVRTNVDDALGQMATARAGLDLARESLELSREDLRVNRQRYELGVATILDLRAAQIALSQAQVDLISRRFDHNVAVARLESLLGTDLQQTRPRTTNEDVE